MHHACHPDGWTEEQDILACVLHGKAIDNRPLFHYSESAPGNNPRKHADYAEKDFYQYGEIDYDVDGMELKMKDKAIAKFMEGSITYEWMVNCTNWSNLPICKFEQLLKGNSGMGIAYFGYAFSNIGLYLLASK